MMKGPEKIVYLKRKTSFIEDSNTDPEVKEYFDMSYKAVGSYYKEIGKQFGSGLTRAEEIVLMPEVTGADFKIDKREFRGATAQFYRNINTKVPPAGVKLNIALQQPDKELSDENIPVKVRDYIIWKHALSHPEVGENYEEAAKYDHVRFYIEDQDAVVKEASGLNKKEDDAFLQYYEIIETPERVDHMLTLLGVSTKNMDQDEKKVTLKSLATMDPRIGANTNEQRLDRFIELAKDKRLAIKFGIEEMIRVDVLERVGQRILIKETSDEIGADLKEATLWFEDKGNTKEVNVLSARFKEFKKS